MSKSRSRKLWKGGVRNFGNWESEILERLESGIFLRLRNPGWNSVAKYKFGQLSEVPNRGVRTQVFSSPTPVLIQEVGILIRILFATQIW